MPLSPVTPPRWYHRKLISVANAHGLHVATYSPGAPNPRRYRFSPIGPGPNPETSANYADGADFNTVNALATVDGIAAARTWLHGYIAGRNAAC